MLVSILNMRVWRNVLTVQVRLTHSRAPHPPSMLGSHSRLREDSQQCHLILPRHCLWAWNGTDHTRVL